jgi:Flp pilus assembly protein TadG
MRRVTARSSFRLWRDDGGASALEFALVLPVFAAMLFGTIQTGMAFYYAGSIQYALERTARLTMVDQDMTAGQVQTNFDNEVGVFTDDNIIVNYSVDNSGDVPVAQLSTSYPYEVIIPFVPAFTLTFDAEARVPLAPAP